MRGAVTAGDPANALRIREYHEFEALRAALRRLADVPPDRHKTRNDRQRRIEIAKVRWWSALQARDAADGITTSCGGVAAHTAAEPRITDRRGQGVAPLPQDNLQVST